MFELTRVFEDHIRGILIWSDKSVDAVEKAKRAVHPDLRAVGVVLKDGCSIEEDPNIVRPLVVVDGRAVEKLVCPVVNIILVVNKTDSFRPIPNGVCPV